MSATTVYSSFELPRVGFLCPTCRAELFRDWLDWENGQAIVAFLKRGD
jgi:hypothetical protein